MNRIARAFIVALTALGFMGCLPGRVEAPHYIGQRVVSAENEQEVFVAAIVEKHKEAVAAASAAGKPAPSIPAWLPGVVEKFCNRQRELFAGIRRWTDIQKKDFGKPKQPVQAETPQEQLKEKQYDVSVDVKNLLVDTGRKKLGMPPVDRDIPPTGGEGMPTDMIGYVLALLGVGGGAAYGTQQKRKAKGIAGQLHDLEDLVHKAAAEDRDGTGEKQG
jgi:hypothetical protein